jgi:hypothetical protein
MFSAWEMNISLADELKALRSRLGTEAADERAKIVAWLRAQNRLASLDLEKILANDIELGEHLK